MIIKRPFEEILTNLREIIMEIAIVLTHISFLMLSIKDQEFEERILFEITSFFCILICIGIEHLFQIISILKVAVMAIINKCTVDSSKSNLNQVQIKKKATVEVKQNGLLNKKKNNNKTPLVILVKKPEHPNKRALENQDVYVIEEKVDEEERDEDNQSKKALHLRKGVSSMATSDCNVLKRSIISNNEEYSANLPNAIPDSNRRFHLKIIPCNIY